jgi:hypothetical protein
MFLPRSSDPDLLPPLGKLDGPVWHFRLFGFPTLKPSFPTGGQHIHNGRLLHSSLHGQNPQQALTNLGESASAVASMVCTTPPKEDKVGTSSVKAPTVQALVAQPGSKALDDNVADNDSDPLNFDVAESVIVCRTSPRL